MKKFRFSLQELLDLREFRAKQAEHELARRAGLVALQEMELERIDREEARTRASRFRGKTGVHELIAEELYLQRLARDRERGLAELARREAARDEALAAYNEANKEKMVLEELEDGELEAFRKEASRREILEIDDIVSGRRAREEASGPRAAGRGI